VLQIPWGISDTDRQNSYSFVHSSYLPQMSLLVGLPESSGGWVRSFLQPASSPWLSMLTYHPGDEQACWWPQLWDIVSPHHNQSITQAYPQLLYLWFLFQFQLCNSYAGMFNLARDDVLPLRRTPLLVTVLFVRFFFGCEGLLVKRGSCVPESTAQATVSITNYPQITCYSLQPPVCPSLYFHSYSRKTLNIIFK
jgi:hypothetical protein